MPKLNQKVRRIQDLSRREWRLIFSPAVDSGLRSMANLMHHAVAEASKRGEKGFAKEVGCFYGSRLLRAIRHLHSGGYSAGWRDKELLPKLHLSNVWIRHGSGEPVFAPFTFISPVAEEKLFEDAHKLQEMQPLSQRGYHAWSLAHLLYEIVHGKPPAEPAVIEASSDFADIFSTLLGKKNNAEERAATFHQLEEMFEKNHCMTIPVKKPPFLPLLDKHGSVIGIKDTGGLHYVSEIVKMGNGPLPSERIQTEKGLNFKTPKEAKEWKEKRCKSVEATANLAKLDQLRLLESLDLPDMWKRSDMPEMALEKFVEDPNPLGSGSFGIVHRVWVEEWVDDPLVGQHSTSGGRQKKLMIREFAKKKVLITTLQDSARKGGPHHYRSNLGELLCNLAMEVAVMGYTQSMSGIANLHYLFVDKVEVSVVMIMICGVESAAKMFQSLSPNPISNAALDLYEWEMALYIDEIAGTLDDLHEKVDKECIIHLDLKLDNVVIADGSGKFLLIDTGQAEFTSSTTKYPYAPYYMAPERQAVIDECDDSNPLADDLLSYGDDITYLADVWSLGSITYLLAKGRNAFPDLARLYPRGYEGPKQAFSKMLAYFRGQPDCTDLDEPLKKFILQALTKSPEMRKNFFEQGKIRENDYLKFYCPDKMKEFREMKMQGRVPFAPLRRKLGNFQLLGYCDTEGSFYVKDHAFMRIPNYPSCSGHNANLAPVP